MTTDQQHAQGTMVLGAGIVGLATATLLQSRGEQVTLIDLGKPGEGTSFGNAGIFANYATFPSVNKKTLAGLPAQLTDRGSAVSVKPRYWPKMIRFGLRQLREVHEPSFANNRRNLTALVQAADGAFRELVALAEAQELVVEHGCMTIYRDPAAWEHVRLHDMPMRQADGVACRAIDGAEIVRLEPALANAGGVGGVFYPDTRHLLSPVALSRRLFDAFMRHGGRFESASARQILPKESGGVELLTDAGSMIARRLVLALGPASLRMVESLGLKVPMVSERGYHITLEPGSVSLSRPVGWLEHYFYATPMGDTVRLAGTSEFAPPDHAPDEQRWDLLTQWAQTLFGPTTKTATRWHGSRMTTPDGLPLVGRLPGHRSIWLATGHGHLGLTLSGITGRLIAEDILGGSPSFGMEALAPGRFMQ